MSSNAASIDLRASNLFCRTQTAGSAPGLSFDRKAPQSKPYRITKQSLGILGAICESLPLGPFMIVATISVWLEDAGAFIFQQKRVDSDGQEFTILKVRTMVKDAEPRLESAAELNHYDAQRTLKVKQGPRVLHFGRLLREFSINNLPQLIIVLCGDIALVAPRTPLPREIDLYDLEEHVRFFVKPGQTCYWQISGRGAIVFKQMAEFDRRYISNKREISVRYLLCEAPEGRVPRKRCRTLISRTILNDASLTIDLMANAKSFSVLLMGHDAHKAAAAYTIMRMRNLGWVGDRSGLARYYLYG